MSHSLTPSSFSQTLCIWQKQYGRHDLPWQISPTAYKVFISEMMLQQTQVTTVIAYFNRWMNQFPTLSSLAQAHLDDVMHLWQGLGYYQRARRIHQAAQYIMTHHKGEFPQCLQALQSIPGVGRYTAGALLSFAYNQYGPIVDGNVRRLFCRYFGIEGVPTTRQVDQQLWDLAERYTPTQNNRQFAQALLDLGSQICAPKKIQCDKCPLQSSCYAYQQNKQADLPTKKPKKVLPEKKGYFLWQVKENKLFLEKRPEQGIWGSLWCLPQINEDLIEQYGMPEHAFDHKFTHYQLHAYLIYPQNIELTHGQWFTPAEIKKLGLPAPIYKLMNKSLKFLS